MRSFLPLRRALSFLAPRTVYRVIGRRPSAVFVDDDLRASSDGACRQRLWDLVFEEYVAQPGDQLQDHRGRLALVTRAGECHWVQLALPQPRAVATAFTHAAEAWSADCALVERLTAEGTLVVVSIKRGSPAPPGPEAKYPEDQPLVMGAGG